MKNINFYIERVKHRSGFVDNIPIAVRKTDEFEKWYSGFGPAPVKINYNSFEECMENVSKCGIRLEYCSKEMRKNKKLCEAAVENDIRALEFCDETFLDDEDFVINAYNKNRKINENELRYNTPFRFCSKKVLGSKKVCEYLIKVNQYAFEYFSEEMRDDEGIALVAVSHPNSRNYEYCSNRVRAIPEVYQAAIRTQGIALEFAPPDVQDDFNICKIAIKKREDSYRCCSERLRDNDELAELALQNDFGLNIKYMSERLQSNPTIIELAIKNGGFNYCNEIVKNTKDYCLMAIRLNLNDYSNISLEMKKDKELLITMWNLCKDDRYYYYKNQIIKNLPIELCDDEEIIKLIYN